MLSNHEARMCRGTHFSFSFVRNPFDRLVSAYNNKILELDEVPGPMQKMGLTHAMPFGDFLDVIADTKDESLDVHLLPQSSILCLDQQLIPSFVGCLETMTEDWKRLKHHLRREGLPNPGNLPQKNVRRGDQHSDVPVYFSDPGLIRIAAERYSLDLEIFYNHKTLDELISGQP